MKLMILHLSDIHLRNNKRNYILDRAEKLASATASVASDVENCFICVTGDIAFSGNSNEYELAEKFFTDIKEYLSNELEELVCHFVFVPGNHDCDFSEEEGREKRNFFLENLTPDNLKPLFCEECTEVQTNYRKFITGWESNGSQSTELSKVYQKSIFDLSEFKVEFHLINSAWMSQIKEKSGNLLYPLQLIDEAPSNSGIVITMLHHPYKWFEPLTARGLSKKLEKISDIILTGHEHDGDLYIKKRPADYEPNMESEYIEGHVLQDSNKTLQSSFNILFIDTAERKQKIQIFSWDKNVDCYTMSQDTKWLPLQRNRHRLRSEFLLKEDFKDWLRDTGTGFQHQYKDKVFLNDIYVIPDLARLDMIEGKDWGAALITGAAVLSFPREENHLLIIGAEKSGKTSLAKIMFREMQDKGLIPVYMSGNDFNKATKNNVSLNVYRAFERIYQSPNSSRFQQLARSKRVLIIDNFHNNSLNTEGRNRTLSILKNTFDTIILFGNESLQFNGILTESKEDFGIWNFTHCRLLPLGEHLRSLLIEKWYRLGREWIIEEGKLSRTMRLTEKTMSTLLGDNFLPSHPVFILILLQYIEARLSSLDTVSNIGASYGFLYEALLTMSLKRVTPRSNLNIMYSYLSELGFLFFKRDVSHISLEELIIWHNNYCDKYRLQLDHKELLGNFYKASILRRNDGNHITFRYPYIYYYFVARYFSKNLEEETIKKYITDMSERLHHSQSANILLFLGYLTSNSFVLSSVLKASQEIFSGYPELDLRKSPEFLEEFMSGPKFVLDDSNSPTKRRRELLKRKDETKLEVRENTVDKEYKAQEIENNRDNIEKHLQINVAFKTIQILGQILRNSLGDLDGEQKLKLTNECYALGLRTLSFIFESIKDNQKQVIDFIVSLIKTQNPNISDRDLYNEAHNFLFVVTENIAFASIKKISDSVGLESLILTFDDLLKEKNMISYKFIDLSIRLDYYEGFPENEAEELYREIRKNPMARYLLRHLIWFYFYIYETPYRLRQSICDKFDIEIKPSLVYNKRVKRPKKR